MSSALAKELAEVLNRHSAECKSDTPDYILAQYLEECLENYNKTIRMREAWYERQTLALHAQIDCELSPEDRSGLLINLDLFDK